MRPIDIREGAAGLRPLSARTAPPLPTPCSGSPSNNPVLKLKHLDFCLRLVTGGVFCAATASIRSRTSRGSRARALRNANYNERNQHHARKAPGSSILLVPGPMAAPPLQRDLHVPAANHRLHIVVCSARRFFMSSAVAGGHEF